MFIYDSPLTALLPSGKGAFCPQETLNMITWPSTPVGQTANESCPCEQSQSNRAFRQCGPNGQWEQPDETLCDLSGIIGSLCPAVSDK